MAATEEVWMPREVHNYDRGSTYHAGMMAYVVVGEVSDSFSVTNGVKQGCVLAPHSSPSSYQQSSTRLSETWGMASTYIHTVQSADLLNVAQRRPIIFGY